MERGRGYSIGELADEVGVSTRTIRYYVSEGLLPPPVGAGPGSRYTDAHREQLEIIGRLKAQYLPLKEIRRRLIGHGVQASMPPASAQMADEMALPLADEFDRSPEVDWTRHERHPSSRQDLASPPQSALHFAEGARPNAAMPPPAPDEEQSWRRIAISDEAELMVTESQYRRHRDKIDWLTQWAKRVLDG